jgi:thioredoxin reductase
VSTPWFRKTALAIVHAGTRTATPFSQTVKQAELTSLVPFAARLLGQPAKLLQGARYRAALGNVPYRTGFWPISAEGKDTLRTVRMTDGNETWTEPCDLLACGFHLVPNTELEMMLGCALAGDFIAVDEAQRTTQPDIYCVGEPTGVAGLDAALVQGRISRSGRNGQVR